MKLKITDKGRWYILNHLERAILISLASGLTTKEAAHFHGFGKNGVEYHREIIYRKTGLRSHVDLCRFAIRLGIIKA